MAAQQESLHFFRTGDTVRAAGGAHGTVVEAQALFAVVAWDDGRRQEVDQFDASVMVIRRTGSA